MFGFNGERVVQAVINSIYTRIEKGQYHTGIVSAYGATANTVYTIEGNSNDSIAARSYSLSNSYIVGYGVNGGTSYGSVPTNSTSGIGLSTQ